MYFPPFWNKVYCRRGNNIDIVGLQFTFSQAIVIKTELRERTSTKHARSADLVTMVMIPTAQFVRYAAVV